MEQTYPRWTVFFMIISWSGFHSGLFSSQETSCQPCHSYLKDFCRCQQYGFVERGRDRRYYNIDRCRNLTRLPNFTNICNMDVLRIDIRGGSLPRLQNYAFASVKYLEAQHYSPELRLANNSIESVEDLAFHDMTGPLGILDLSFNRLREIPNAVSALTSLTELHVQNNNITNEGVRLDRKALKNVIILDLSNNKLTTIPEDLCGTVSPIHLRLHGNPMEKALSHYTPILSRCWRLLQVTWPHRDTTCDCETIVPLATDISSEYVYQAIYPTNRTTDFVEWAPVMCDGKSIPAFAGRPISTISDMEVLAECIRNDTGKYHHVCHRNGCDPVCHLCLPLLLVTISCMVFVK